MKEIIFFIIIVFIEFLIFFVINVGGKDVVVFGVFKYSFDMLKGWLDVLIEGDELDKSLWEYKFIFEGFSEM